MFCPQCGSDCGSDPNMKFCPTCGFDLLQDQQQPAAPAYDANAGYNAPAYDPNAAAPAYDPNAGAPAYDPNYGAPAYDPNYGAAPNYGAPAQAPAAAPAAKKGFDFKKLPIVPILGGVAGVIVVVLLISLFAGGGRWFKKSTPAGKVLAAAEKTVFSSKSLKFEAKVYGDECEGTIQLGSNLQKTKAIVKVENSVVYVIGNGKAGVVYEYGNELRGKGFDVKDATKVLKGGAKAYVEKMKENYEDAEYFKTPDKEISSLTKLVKKVPNIVKGKKLNKSVVEDFLDLYIHRMYASSAYYGSDKETQLASSKLPDFKDVLKLVNGLLSNGKVKKSIESSKSGNVTTLKVDLAEFAEAAYNYLSKNSKVKQFAKDADKDVDDILEGLEEMQDMDDVTLKIKATIEKGRLTKVIVSMSYSGFGSRDIIEIKVSNINKTKVSDSKIKDYVEAIEDGDYIDDFNEFLEDIYG